MGIQDNDILFFDFGPIIENWEADLGRTYVIGNDPMKLKLKDIAKKPRTGLINKPPLKLQSYLRTHNGNFYISANQVYQLYIPELLYQSNWIQVKLDQRTTPINGIIKCR